MVILSSLNCFQDIVFGEKSNIGKNPDISKDADNIRKRSDIGAMVAETTGSYQVHAALKKRNVYRIL